CLLLCFHSRCPSACLLFPYTTLFRSPIFFSLYSFFNATIELRGQNFLWADDLSSYDSILNFGFNIPFYGSHISLFTILATVTSLDRKSTRLNSSHVKISYAVLCWKQK